jgi:hypothetical protein
MGGLLSADLIDPFHFVSTFQSFINFWSTLRTYLSLDQKSTFRPLSEEAQDGTNPWEGKLCI